MDIEKFVKNLENYELEQKKLPVGERNILPTCTEAQLAMDCMIECFLGDDWYVDYPCSAGQVNTEACFAILRKHSRKFRRLIKQASRRLKDD